MCEYDAERTAARDRINAHENCIQDIAFCQAMKAYVRSKD
jgi:hypothetical protein